MTVSSITCESSKPFITGGLLSLSAISFLVRHRLALTADTWRRCLLAAGGAGLVGAFVVYLHEDTFNINSSTINSSTINSSTINSNPLRRTTYRNSETTVSLTPIELIHPHLRVFLPTGYIENAQELQEAWGAKNISEDGLCLASRQLLPKEWINKIKNWPILKDKNLPSKHIKGLEQNHAICQKTVEELEEKLRLAESNLRVKKEETVDDDISHLENLITELKNKIISENLSLKQSELALEKAMKEEDLQKIQAFRKRANELKEISLQFATCQTMQEINEAVDMLKKFLYQLPSDEHFFFSSLPLQTERKQELILPQLTSLASVVEGSISLKVVKPLALSLWFLWRHLQPDPNEDSGCGDIKKKAENSAPPKAIRKCADALNIDIKDYL